MDNTQIKEELKKIFIEQFKKNGYEASDFFDFSIWFIKNNDSKISNSNFFKEVLSQTPSENDDIIIFLLIRSFIRTKNKNYKIKVEDFIEEIIEVIVNLHQENKRVNRLIESYDAYVTKNTIEQNLKFYDKYMKNYELMKSKMQFNVTKIENITKGDYKFSLMVSYINTNVTYIDDYEDKVIKEQIYDYKLNHIVKVNEDKATLNFNEIKDYSFPEIEFYSYELNNKIKENDSGTNMLYFYIKSENLNKNFDEIVYSDKKPILDLFLSNIKNLLNNFKKTITLDTECEIKNQYYDYKLKLRVNVELDPWTLSSIFNKVTSLLQNMISYKVLVDHKWKTIMNYFPETNIMVDELFDERKNEKKNDCVIY